MVKRTGPSERQKKELIVRLERTKVPIWKDVSEKLASPRRQKAEVNVKRINRNAEDGETIVVPGTVMGDGNMEKTVNVAAWKITPLAEEKIKKAKGAVMTIDELFEKNPKGSNVRIMV